MRYFVTLEGSTVEVDLSGERPRVNGREVEADLAQVAGSSLWHLRADGRSYPLDLRPGIARGEWEVTIGGRNVTATAVDERTRTIRDLAGAQEVETERTILAPMPGLVVRVEVEVGEAVRAGQGVVIVEAMKMENELKAPGDGVVARIEVEAGETVEKGAVLLVLE